MMGNQYNYESIWLIDSCKGQRSCPTCCCALEAMRRHTLMKFGVHSHVYRQSFLISANDFSLLLDRGGGRTNQVCGDGIFSRLRVTFPKRPPCRSFTRETAEYIRYSYEYEYLTVLTF